MYGNQGMADRNARIEMIRRLWLFGSEGELQPTGSTGSTPPAVDPPATDPPANEPPVVGDPPEPETFDRPYVEKIRAEAAANRVKAREYEAKLKEYEDRDLSEMDKAKKVAEEAAAERDNLRAELTETKRHSLVHKIAAELRFNDPSDAIALLPSLDPGDDGLPSERAVKGALESILKSKPYLAAVQSPGGGDGNFRGSTPPASDERVKALEEEFRRRGGVPVR